MHTPFRTWCIRMLFLAVSLLLFSGIDVSAAHEPGQVKGFYSPIVRIEAEKGFFMIVPPGIPPLWIQVGDNAKPHLQELNLGDMIDVTVQFRPDNLPPILQSWKLARSESACKLFDGKTCKKE